MSEMDETPPTTSRRSVELMLARVEAKLDVAIAQQTARLDEHGRRIGENTAAISAADARIGLLEQARSADEARDAAEAAARPQAIGTAGWVAIVIGLLGALYLILDHYIPGAK